MHGRKTQGKVGKLWGPFSLLKHLLKNAVEAQ